MSLAAVGDLLDADLENAGFDLTVFGFYDTSFLFFFVCN